MLERDGYICQLRSSPRCRGYANTAHHLEPTSQALHRFYDETKVVAARGACNYSHGARLTGSRSRQTIAVLQELVEQQQAEIAELAARLADYENGDEPRRARAVPRIH